MRGVFFTRTYVTDLHRDSVFTYFGKQDVTGFSWYHSPVYSRRTSSYRLPEISNIYTAIYIYYPYDDIDSIWNWLFSLLESTPWFLISLNSTLLLRWSWSYLDSYCSFWFYFLWFLSPEFNHSLLKPVAEIRAHSGSKWTDDAVRSGVKALSSLLTWFYHSLLYRNFEDEIFIKVGRM